MLGSFCQERKVAFGRCSRYSSIARCSALSATSPLSAPLQGLISLICSCVLTIHSVLNSLLSLPGERHSPLFSFGLEALRARIQSFTSSRVFAHSSQILGQLLKRMFLQCELPVFVCFTSFSEVVSNLRGPIKTCRTKSNKHFIFTFWLRALAFKESLSKRCNSTRDAFCMLNIYDVKSF